MHRTEDPTPIRSLIPELPLSVEGALLQALRKDPGERFSTCEAFGAAIGCRFVSDPVSTPEILMEADAVLGPRIISSIPGLRTRLRMVLTVDSLWIVRFHDLAVVRRPLETISVTDWNSHTLFFRSSVGRWSRGFSLRFTSSAERINCHQAILDVQENSVASMARSKELTTAGPIVLVDRRPAERYQLLGATESSARTRAAARAGMAIRCAIRGGDGVSDIREEKIVVGGENFWRASGSMILAVDNAARKQIRSRCWYDNINSLTKATIAYCAVCEVLILAATYSAFGSPYWQVHMWFLASILWPATLIPYGLRRWRIPELIAPTIVSIMLSWGLVYYFYFRDFKTMYWYLLDHNIRGSWIWPVLAIVELLSWPLALVLGILGLSLALKLWRTRREYRLLLVPSRPSLRLRRGLVGLGATLLLIFSSLLVVSIVDTFSPLVSRYNEAEGDPRMATAVTLVIKGNNLRLSRPQQAETSYLEALALFQELMNDQELEERSLMYSTRLYLDLSELAISSTQVIKGEDLARKAVEAGERLWRDHRSLDARHLMMEARIHAAFVLWQADQAGVNPGRSNATPPWIELIQTNLALDANHAPSWFAMGRLHICESQPILAINALERSIALKGDDNVYAWFSLAEAYSLSGEAGKARAWYDKATHWTKAHQPIAENVSTIQAEASSILDAHR